MLLLPYLPMVDTIWGTLFIVSWFDPGFDQFIDGLIWPTMNLGLDYGSYKENIGTKTCGWRKAIVDLEGDLAYFGTTTFSRVFDVVSPI